MLAVEDLPSQGFDTVVIATADVQGRLVGRRLPLRRFLARPAEGVDVSAYALACDLTGTPQAVPFA